MNISPYLVLFLAEDLLAHDERPQPFPGHVARLLFEPVVVLDDGHHDDVGAFLVERDFPGLDFAHDNPHPLRLAFEGENLRANEETGEP